jgi:predicted nucleic acid-binding protein
MRVVLDSNVFVSAFDPKDTAHSLCLPVLESVLAGSLEVVCPKLVLIETVCALNRRVGDSAVSVSIAHELARMPTIAWCDLDLDMTRRACQLGVSTGLRGGDAIVMQVAEDSGLPLVTEDKEIKLRAPQRVAVISSLELMRRLRGPA